MTARLARHLLTVSCFTAALALSASAQNRGPGGPPRGPGGPGMPGGPGGMGMPGERGDRGDRGPIREPRNAPSANPAASPNNGNASRSATPLGPPGRWWDNKTVVNSIGLRKDQQRRMDSIFDANKGAILASYKDLETQKARLDQLTKASNVDQAAVFAQVDAVAQARSALQKTTIKVLLEIRQQMDPDQVARIEKLQ